MALTTCSRCDSQVEVYGFIPDLADYICSACKREGYGMEYGECPDCGSVRDETGCCDCIDQDDFYDGYE